MNWENVVLILPRMVHRESYQVSGLLSDLDSGPFAVVGSNLGAAVLPVGEDFCNTIVLLHQVRTS
jgi:hypothetical protein